MKHKQICFYLILLFIDSLAMGNNTDINSVSTDSSTVSSTSAATLSLIDDIKDAILKGRATDLAKTAFSSVRGLLNSPVNALVYLGSLAIGAVVMLAFYESPISPLPVPPLPDPPVGRFPPEHPIWPPPPKTPIRQPSPSENHPIRMKPPILYHHQPYTSSNINLHSHPKINTIHRRTSMDKKKYNKNNNKNNSDNNSSINTNNNSNSNNNNINNNNNNNNDLNALRSKIIKNDSTISSTTSTTNNEDMIYYRMNATRKDDKPGKHLLDIQIPRNSD